MKNLKLSLFTLAVTYTQSESAIVLHTTHRLQLSPRLYL